MNITQEIREYAATLNGSAGNANGMTPAENPQVRCLRLLALTNATPNHPMLTYQ